VTTGTPEQLDHDLQTLADRIPRYLQLGPGEKVTGSTRQTVEPGVEHAVTGVVNRSLIQIVYNALRGADLDVTWVEPLLVSVARLTGTDASLEDQPVLIADGLGKQWDVGIACMGRLLLDYRPAAANNNENFCKVLQGHFERLKRFCARHRGVATGQLNDLLVFGEEGKLEEVLDRLKKSDRLSPRRLRVPNLPDLYHVEPSERITRNVPAVATVYPLLVGIEHSEVADLLDHVRRAPDLSAGQRLLRLYWPVAVAAICLLISYGLVSAERSRHAGTGNGRAALQAEIIATNVKQSRISRNQKELNHLRRVESFASEHRWDHLFGWITKMLPPSMKLKEFRVDSGNTILMEGAALDETMIYEWVNSLRHLPKVSQVALKGTTPNAEDQSTGFTVQLKIHPTALFRRSQQSKTLEVDR
jgi:Tfp pilus assembly protein PilN